MNTYIALLRSINVMGKNMLSMESLKKMFESMQYRNVRTYIQSGNVIFHSERPDPDEIGMEISQYLQNSFGLNVPVIVLTREQLREVISHNPYPLEAQKDPSFMHVTFLASRPQNEKLDEIKAKAIPGEEFILIDKAVYLYLPHGYGRTKLNNTIFEKKFKVNATTRNWKTVLQLGRMAEE